jgi:DNA-binding CsgD family transcriptional regulator
MAGLTKMERKVAEMVARGRTNFEIAADLKITERTVKAHLTSVYEKTKTGNRLALALLINRG